MDDGVFRPTKGDLLVCHLCGKLNMFGEGGELRAVSDAEIAELDPELQAAIAALRAFVEINPDAFGEEERPTIQ